MSTLKHVILHDKDQDVEKKLDWSYIEWAENEVITTGVANAQTQTDWGPFEHKESQTSNPVIMHIDLTRTHSKLRHSSLVDTDGLVAPLFQFDRQAPARISTSPTLRRMRSTRRPLIDSRDPLRMGSTQEEPSSAGTPPPIRPLSPVHRVKSPLAASPLSDGEICHDHQPISSSGRQRTRSYRSKTFDSGITSTRQECRSAHPTLIKDFGFLHGEVQEKDHCYTRLQERRRSSVVVSLPGLDVSPGDLFVSNGAAGILSDTKKSKWPFSRRSTTKGKLQTGTVSDIEKYLSTAQIQDWRDTDLQKYKVNNEYCQLKPLNTYGVSYVNHLVGAVWTGTFDLNKVRGSTTNRSRFPVQIHLNV